MLGVDGMLRMPQLLFLLVAHTYIGPGPLAIIAFTWFCQVIPLIVVGPAVELFGCKAVSTGRWDCINGVVPFAVFCLASQITQPSVAGFFFNGMILGLAIGCVPFIRALVTKSLSRKRCSRVLRPSRTEVPTGSGTGSKSVGNTQSNIILAVALCLLALVIGILDPSG